MHSTLLTIFIFSALTAVATGIGAIPFFWIKELKTKHIGLLNALAAGLMLGASFDLIIKGFSYSPLNTGLGALVGVLVIVLTQALLRGAKHIEPDAFLTAKGQKMLLIMVIMTVHSFAEGISMGAAFADTVFFGLLIFAAMALQNIPEGLAISTVLVPRGESPWKAMGWSIFSSLPQPIMAVPAFLFVEHFRGVLPGALGFAAGAMLWMIFDELIPEARKETRAWFPTVGLATVAMVLLIIRQ